MPTVLITGGTGMVGKQLTELLLLNGYSVIIVSRKASAKHLRTNVAYAVWDIEKQTIDADAIAKADYIVHLAGAGVADKRWSKERKKEIVESRTKSSATIVKALKETTNNVQAVISASAIGWYGADTVESKQNGFKENEPADTAFLGDTCRLWEESIAPVTVLDKRLVKLRIGIVLSNDGGALAEFKKPLLGGIAAILGSGKQVISWIHIDDLCRMFLHAIQHENMQGVYNAVATNPVTNKTLTLTLANIKRGKFYIPIHVPEFVLKIMLGEMSIEVLKSATVSNQKVLNFGFKYEYPTIEEALKSL